MNSGSLFLNNCHMHSQRSVESSTNTLRLTKENLDSGLVITNLYSDLDSGEVFDYKNYFGCFLFQSSLLILVLILVLLSRSLKK